MSIKMPEVNFVFENVLITPPGGVANLSTIELRDTNRFTSYTPKLDTINAVKLTVSNIRTIAAHVLKTIGGTVQVDGDVIFTGPPSPVDGRPGGAEFAVGEWIVEEYDYHSEKIYFGTATVEERKKYDLR